MSEGFNTNVCAIRDIANNLLKQGEYIKDARKIKDDEMRIDTVIGNQNRVILKVLETAKIYNKGKEKPLKKFLDKYLLNMSLLDEKDLEGEIYYYIELYDEINNTGGSEKLDFDIIHNPSIYSKKEILFELLFSNTYLPKYIDQAQFYEQMIFFIDRIGKRLIKYMLSNSPVIISSVNPKTLLFHMEDLNANSVSGVKYIEQGILKAIGYNFAMNSIVNMKDKDEFYINAIINATDENGITRNEFISYLMNDMGMNIIIPNKEYSFKTDDLFDYHIYIGESFDIGDLEYNQDGFSGVKAEYGFEIRLYALPKRTLNPKENFSNICFRLPMLANQFVLDIYESFGRDINGRIGYPEKPVVFDISKMLNARKIQEMDNIPYEDNDNFAFTNTRGNKKSKKHYDFIKIKYTPELVLDAKLKKEVDIFIDRINSEDKYYKLGLELPRGLILYGPSGTGKTSLAKYIAAKTNNKAVFLEVLIDKIKGMYVGESEKAARQLFIDMRSEVSKGKIVISFIDEIDGLIGSGEKKDDVDSGLRSVLLSEMEGIVENKNKGIIFIGATNHIDNISKAYLRRFDKTMLVDLPQNKQRKKLIELYLKKTNSDIFDSNLDFELLVQKTSDTPHSFYKVWFEHIIEKYVYTQQKTKINTQDMLDQIEISKSEESSLSNPIGFVH